MDIEGEMVLPVAINAAAALHKYLAMAWLFIERYGLALQIINHAAVKSGEKIEGRRKYFSHRFKAFIMTQTENWKACVYFQRRFCINVQTKMGRVLSPNRESISSSFLISAIAIRLAAVEVSWRLELGDMPEKVAQWIKTGRERLDLEQALPFLFLVFRDEIVKLTVGPFRWSFVQRTKKDVIWTELGAELSDKPEANQRFVTTVEFIGTELDTVDYRNVIR